MPEPYWKQVLRDNEISVVPEEEEIPYWKKVLQEQSTTYEFEEEVANPTLDNTFQQEPEEKEEYNNFDVYSNEYENLHPKTKETLKEFTYGEDFNDPEGNPESINSPREYAMFMMNNEDDVFKQSSQFTPEEGQIARDRILKQDMSYRRQESVNGLVTEMMTGGELSTEDLELIQKVTAGDEEAIQQLMWKKSPKSLKQMMAESTGLVRTSRQQRDDKHKIQRAIKEANNVSKEYESWVEQMVDDPVGFYKEMGDPWTQGAQNLMKQAISGVWNYIPSFLKSLSDQSPLVKALELKPDYNSVLLNKKASKEEKLGNTEEAKVLRKRANESQKAYEEANFKQEEERYAAIEDLFYRGSQNINEWAERSLDADPITGELAKPAENLLDWLDPRRMYTTLAHNAPLMGVLAAESIYAPHIAAAHMMAIGGGDVKTTVLEYEKENGVKLTPFQREQAVHMVGLGHMVLEKLGLDIVIGKLPLPVKGKLMRALVSSFSERETEGAQEFLSIWAAVKDSPEFYGLDLPSYGYRDLTDEDLYAIKSSKYAGTILGFLGGGAAAQIQTDSETEYSSSDRKLANNVTVNKSIFGKKLGVETPMYTVVSTNRDGDIVDQSKKFFSKEEADEYANNKKAEIVTRLAQNGGERDVNGEIISDGEVITDTDSDFEIVYESEGESAMSDLHDEQITDLSKANLPDEDQVNIPKRTGKRNSNKVLNHVTSQMIGLDKVISGIQTKMQQAEKSGDREAYNTHLDDLTKAVDLKNNLKARLEYAERRIPTPDVRHLDKDKREYLTDYQGKVWASEAPVQMKFEFKEPVEEVAPVEEVVEEAPTEEVTEPEVETREQKKARLKKEKAERKILPVEQPTEPNQIAVDYKYKGVKGSNLLEKRDGTWYNLQDNKPVKNKAIVKKAEKLLSEKKVTKPKVVKKTQTRPTGELFGFKTESKSSESKHRKKIKQSWELGESNEEWFPFGGKNYNIDSAKGLIKSGMIKLSEVPNKIFDALAARLTPAVRAIEQIGIDQSRVDRADTSVPIIMGIVHNEETGRDEGMVLDGNHRLLKAIDTGIDNIYAYVLSKEQTDAILQGEMIKYQSIIEKKAPEVAPTTIKDQDFDTRVKTDLTEDEDIVYVDDIRNGKTGKPLAWVKNIKTKSISGFTKAAKKLQKYVDDHYGSENDQTDMNVDEAESAIQSMEEILEGRDLQFDDDFNVVDAKFEEEAEAAAIEGMTDEGIVYLEAGIGISKQAVTEYLSSLKLSNLKKIYAKGNLKEKLKVNTFATELNRIAEESQKKLGITLVSDETLVKSKKTPEDLEQIGQTQEFISDLIVEEVNEELKDPKSAKGWYSEKMAKAINIIGEVHPEILTDKDAETRFKAGLAITSNGTDVVLNTEFGELVYNHYKKNGEFPTDWDIYGTQKEAINKSFKKYNELVEILGESDVNKFLNTKYTIKDLQSYGIKVSGENVDYKVPGAVIFGPKVGGGFYPNLMGEYQYLTMDRWFMRTIGRLRGNLAQTKDYTVQIRKFRKFLKASKATLDKYDVDIPRLKNDDYAFDIAQLVYRDFAKSKSKTRGTFGKKTLLNNSSRALINRIEPKIAPRGGYDRQFMRGIMQLVADKTGMEVADLQAVVWFPEKELYYDAGIGDKTTKGTDFEQESRKLVDRFRAGKLDRWNVIREVGKVGKGVVKAEKAVTKFTEKQKLEALEKIRKGKPEVTPEDSEGILYLQGGMGLTQGSVQGIYNSFIKTKTYVHGMLPEKVRKQGEVLGINSGNFSENFSKAAKNLGGLAKNTKAWFKKVFTHMKRWYKNYRNIPIYQEGSLSPELENKYNIVNEESHKQKIEEDKQGKKPKDPHSLTSSIKDLVEVLSVRAKKVGVEVKKVLRDYQKDLDKNTIQDMEKAEGFLAIYKKLKEDAPDTVRKLDVAILLRDKAAIDEIVKQYPEVEVVVKDKKVLLNLETEFNDNIRNLMMDMWQRGNDAFGELGLIEEEEGKIGYFPRDVNNLDGLREALRGMLVDKVGEKKTKGIIDDGLGEYAKEKGKKVEELTVNETSKVINQIIYRRLKGKKGVSFKKSRTIDTDDIELMSKLAPFYTDSATSLIGYIQKMNEGIAKQKLFGKGINPDTLEFEEDFEGTIGGLYADKLLDKENYTPDEQREIVNIFSTILETKHTPKSINTIKALGYIGTMGDFINTLTQLGDTAVALGRSIATNPLDVATSFGRAVRNKSEIKMRDVYIEDIAAEMRTAEGMMKVVNKIFKLTGLKRLDRIGKETLVNSQVMKLRKDAIVYRKQKGIPKDLMSTRALEFELKMSESFSKGEFENVINELMAGEFTPNTITLAYNALLDHQPVASTELPAAYLRNPNARVFYQLKTWAIRTLNVFAEDIQGNNKAANRLEKQGNLEAAKKLRRSGYKKAIQLAVVLSIAGGGVEQLKDLLLGKPTKFSDNVIESLMRLFFLSRYTTDKLFEGDLGQLWDTATEIPVIGIGESAIKDIGLIGRWATVGLTDKESLEYGLSFTKHIPFVGKFVYYGGRGRKMELQKAIRAYNKQGRLSAAEKRMKRMYERELQQIKRFEKRGKKSTSKGGTGRKRSRRRSRSRSRNR